MTSPADRLRALVEASTKGPWEVTDQGDLARGVYENSMPTEDAALIVVLREIAPALVKWASLNDYKYLDYLDVESHRALLAAIDRATQCKE